MALCCVQNAVLVREMRFKNQFLCQHKFGRHFGIRGHLVCIQWIGCLEFGLLAAYHAARRSCGLLGACGLAAALDVFSLERLRKLFDYGWKILAGSLLSVLYNNVYNLVIGKHYSATELGYYNRGRIIPTILVENAANAINSVMFPALASIQDDKARFIGVVRKMVSTVAFIVFMLIGVLLPLSPAVIGILLTDRWLPAVPFMQLVCITVCFTPFILINSAILTALGESSKYLKAVTISKILSISMIFAASFVNVYFMVGCGALAAIMSVAIMGSWNNRLIGYSPVMFVKDILPSMAMAIATASIVFCIMLLELNSILTIPVGGPLAVRYFFLAHGFSSSNSLKFLRYY